MCFSFWGTTKSPRPPTGAPPMDPAGGLPSPRPPHLCSSKISFKKPWHRLETFCVKSTLHVHRRFTRFTALLSRTNCFGGVTQRSVDRASPL